MPQNDVPRVEVLLCTYNGAPHLVEQLDTIRDQQDVEITIRVSDDGSDDGTLAILDRWHSENPTVSMSVRAGPGLGHSANFLSLAQQDLHADSVFFAYSDQDDLWEEDKLSRAVQALSGGDPERPSLYCSRTRAVDDSGGYLNLSPNCSRPPSFANALLQNLAGGNTMVFNTAAKTLLENAGVVDVVSHDWWTYQIVSGAGGRVIYDPVPSVSYRQHGNNAVGHNRGLAMRLKRYSGWLSGRNREWNERNIAALARNRHLLTPENRDLLDCFRQVRQSGPLGRLKALSESGIYAQTVSGSIGSYFAAFLGKL